MNAYDGNTFTYDARGRRIGKNGITFTYDSNGNLIKQSNGLEFLYDHSGVFAVKYNNATYYYRKDAQSNIVELLDNTGATVVKYKYDAWGNCHVLNADGSEITDSNHIGILNPFRYRSYYYDTETNLYFLKTRYYNPEIGRFMTIDDLSYLDPDSINGLNLYAYCGNNPIKYCDPSGTVFITTAIIVGLIAGALIGGTVGGVYAYNRASAAGATGWSLVGQTVLGVLGGAVIGAAIGGLAGYAIGGLITTLAPYIGAFLSSSFPIFAPVMMDGALGYAVVATVTGAQIAGGAAVALGAGVLMFASDHRPKNNQVQNKQFKKAAEEAGFNPKDPYDMDILNEIHQYIRENGLDLGWKKLVELMKQWR